MVQKRKDSRPARARYRNEERWKKNKERRIKKQARIEEKKRLKKEGKHERTKSGTVQDQGNKETSQRG